MDVTVIFPIAPIPFPVELVKYTFKYSASTKSTGFWVIEEKRALSSVDK